MSIIYFKRFHMEYDLGQPLFPEPSLPQDYLLLPWEEDLLAVHAEVKYQCFRHELDANVFPNLGKREGCRRLMDDIVFRGRFVPQATWLLQYWPPQARRPEACGTIQGMVDDTGTQPLVVGAVQNVGVLQRHRGLGLGSSLLHHSLAGFRAAGMHKVFLEVTAKNTAAIRLYERLGFRTTRVVYKAAEVYDAEVAYA